jgi:glycosyltransferase involved in cell wall biosynthesis
MHNETNRRLPASLNRGFREARGEYLTWTSDDNLYEPKALEEMLNVLLEDPKVGLVYTDFSDIDEQGETKRSVKVAESNELAYGNCVRACFLYRRKVYSKVGDYDERMFLVEDWDYWLRALKHFKLVPLHKNLYRYRWHGNSLTTTKKETVKEAIEKLLLHHLCDASLLPRAARAKGYIKLLQFALDRGDRSSARSYFAAALRCSPHLALRGRRSLAVSLFLGEKPASLAAAFARALRLG